MSFGEQNESQSASYFESSIRARLLAFVQQTGADEHIVEDFRQTLGMLTRVAPRSLSANGTLQRSPNNREFPYLGDNERRRSDTVIVLDSTDSTNNSSSPPNEIALTVPTGQDQQANGETTSSTSNVERNIQREMNHFREFMQNSENRRDVKAIASLILFLLLVLLENILENLVSSIMFVLPFICFHFSNASLISSIAKKSLISTIQPIVISSLYFFTAEYFNRLRFFLFSLCFIGGLPMESGFFETLYVVLITDEIVKLITIPIKALVLLVPKGILNVRRQRRIFQLIEYTSQLYRYFLPIPHWSRYFSYSFLSVPAMNVKNSFAVIYISYKFFASKKYFISFLKSLLYVFHITSIGQKPSKLEVDEVGQCTICFSDLKFPIKLSCKHIFCEECIGTWLDKEYSCPICRATVAVEDNSWKSGETTYMIQIY